LKILQISFFIASLGFGVICFGQSLEVPPAATLEEFREYLRPYDPFLIQLTMSDSNEWQAKIDAIREILLIESINEDSDIRSDWLVFTMKLERVGDSERPYRDGWHYKENYTVVYTPKSASELEREECMVYEIKGQAPWGITWREIDKDDSKHRCLEITPQNLLLGKRTYLEGTIAGAIDDDPVTVEVDVFIEFDGTVDGELIYSAPAGDFEFDVDCLYTLRDDYFLFTGPTAGEETSSDAIWAILEVQNPTTREPDGWFRLTQRRSEVALEQCNARGAEYLVESASGLRILSGEIGVDEE
jgi:hypothetical protein